MSGAKRDAAADGGATMARMIARTYKTFREEGLPEEVALALTKEWLRALYANLPKAQAGGGPDLAELMKIVARS